MAMKLGMKSFKIEKIKLKFGSYLNMAALPPVPNQFGHVLKSAPPGGWRMLGNDNKGDCTIAGIAHGQMVWDWATQKKIPLFADQQIISQYMHLTGGVDSGLDPVDVAAWWRDTGLTDASGHVHKIDAYVAVTNPQQAIEAAYLFGFSGLGFWLPKTAERQFTHGSVWNDVGSPPDPDAGHFVPLVGCNSQGHFMVVTWGKLHAATPEWVDKYFAGGVAYVSKDYMLASGLSPEGFNFDRLAADLKALTS